MKKFALSGAFLTNSDKKEDPDMMAELFSSLLKRNVSEEKHSATLSETKDGGNADKSGILAELYPDDDKDNGKMQEDKDKTGFVKNGSNDDKHGNAALPSDKNATKEEKRNGSDYYSPPPYYSLF